MNATECKLTAGDVIEITEVTKDGLIGLEVTGLVKPEGGGKQGKYKTYSILDALAIAYLGAYAESMASLNENEGSVRNFHLGIDAGVYVQSLGIEQVVTELAAGNKYVVPGSFTASGIGCIVSEVPVLSNGDRLNIPDLGAVYAEVMRKVQEIRSRPPVKGAGRRTGLIAK